MASQQSHNPTLAKYYNRFTLAQRIEHIVLLVSFTALAVTGLPQKFAGNAFAEWAIAVLGGIEFIRIVHRIAAVMLVLMSVYHVIVLGYKVWVRRIEMTMLPGLKDVTDALDVLRYNLGLSKEHPRMPRYNFGEKVEYWAMVWGTIIMAITGFMLWNPISTARFVPGQVIPAAKAAHGAEALLAVLAIIVWHFYNVHVKSFNKSMFTGNMTRHQMEEEHGQELERRIAGKTRPAPDPAGVRRRERLYLPVAIVLALIAVFAVYRFATFEQTAIATLPAPIEHPQVFTPLTPTPGPVVTQVAAALIPHPIQGQEQCDTCHGPTGVKPMPEDHAGRPNESCTVCHLQGPTPTPGPAGSSAPGAAPAIPHTIEGDTYKDCTTCHGLGKIKPFPEGHASFSTDSCTGCHKPAADATGGAASGTPAAGETPAAGATPAAGGASAGPAAIPHPVGVDPYTDCTQCHGLDKIKPFPENHTAFTTDQCTSCHQPAATGGATGGTGSTGGTVAAAPAIPTNHDLTSPLFQDCTTCHGIGKLKPFPENHTSFTVDQCQTCHKQAAQ